MNFETTPPGIMSKREPEPTSEATGVELGQEGKFTTKSCDWVKTVFP